MNGWTIFWITVGVFIGVVWCLGFGLMVGAGIFTKRGGKR